MNTTTQVREETSVGEEVSARWVMIMLGTVAFAILVNIAIAYRMDVYGIFRDPHGRSLITSHHERKSKFLLNQEYVPANYDALVIGASSQVNWHLEYLSGYRFYNESIEGGDASEERRLVEQALPNGHFKVALVGLYPRITQIHILQDGFDQVTRYEALGSISSLAVEYDTLSSRLTHSSPAAYPNGSHNLPTHAPPVARPGGSQMNIALDPVSVADYRAMIQELQAKGTRIIYVVDPIFDPTLEYNRENFSRYLQTITQALPAGPVINLNAPEFKALRSDPINFIDEVHLSATGADRFSRALNTQLQLVMQPAGASSQGF